MASRSTSRALTDHDEIRRWAEERGAKPAAVRDSGAESDDPGIIRLDFPGYSGGTSLEEITWDEWFEDFEDNELALVVQDKMTNGQKSNFNKLVSRDSVTDSAQSESTGAKAGGSRGARNPKSAERPTSEKSGRSPRHAKRPSKKKAA